ncbi:hypothetical protein BCV69DRAFT_37546 [Microstroma glucosiphilum]|uniref:BZIP domain-containing protein n=1 Tax=Pseudomicrostroma glucosiphilum TaxID=1684307 RepID=A0A316U1Z5_9BASI|nr:hypothetical protein BCV69DRAFT_37546 [Pseudomicrostroma glucosiphilum]PWN19379.1 hypothetical protein BCV69DRAFT_37546 [Pseudomicrostroma glucosiphilum]
MADKEAAERAAQAARARKQLKKHQQQKKKKGDGDATGTKGEAPTTADVEQAEQDAPKADAAQGSDKKEAVATIADRAETPKPESNGSSSLQATIATLVSEKSGLADQLAELEAKLQHAEESLRGTMADLEESESLKRRLKDLEEEVEKSKAVTAKEEAARVQAEDKISQLVSLRCRCRKGQNLGLI